MLQVIRKSETQYDPVFQKILEDIPGGVSVKGADLPITMTKLNAGTVLGTSGADSLYHVIKTAEVYADSATTKVKVLKGHAFVANDFISNGNKSVKISSIDTTNGDYDEFTCSASITVVDGQILYHSTSAGTEPENVALNYVPAGFLKNLLDIKDAVKNESNLNAGCVVRGTVVESLLPFKLDDNGLIKTALTDRIRFA